MINYYVSSVIEKYNLRYPLNIWEFVRALGFRIKYVDTGDADAYTIIMNGKKLILLNQSIDSRRVNFTLAHELGHYFIPHHLEPLYACNINEVVSTKDLNQTKEEREANLFASELLLPSRLIKQSSNINSFQDILGVAEKYDVSIQATAIKMIEHTDDVVCFVCCKNGRIKWYTTSLNFREYLRFKDIVGGPVSKLSSLNSCIENNIDTIQEKVPAYIWIENREPDAFVDEEVLYYPQYDLAYILIKAESLVNLEEELFL